MDTVVPTVGIRTRPDPPNQKLAYMAHKTRERTEARNQRPDHQQLERCRRILFAAESDR